MKAILNTKHSMIVDEHFLFAGTVFVSKKPCLITTVLGSCVSICLWDSEKNIGGMNHYQLPFWNGNGLASPKYGNVAIKTLIEKMYSRGCQPSQLIAKIFGGASVLQCAENNFVVGKRNIHVAQLLLEEMKISVMSSDLGGDYGRKLKFNTKTGEVFMKRIINNQ
ncbi:chemotaxis protein CheD [bacterium]